MLLTLIQQFGVHFKLKALLCFCAFNRPGSVWPQHIPAHVFLTVGYLQLFIHWFTCKISIHCAPIIMCVALKVSVVRFVHLDFLKKE